MKILKTLGITFLLTVALAGTALASFSDVPATAPYAKSVANLAEQKIMEGSNDGRFWPNKSLTRAEAAAIICRALQGDSISQLPSFPVTPYADVPSQFWANSFITDASSRGIMSGYGNGSFGPMDTVTYDQYIKMLVCALDLEHQAKLKGGWPTGYLQVAREQGLTAGMIDNTMAISRGQVAILTDRMMQVKAGPSAKEMVRMKIDAYKTFLKGYSKLFWSTNASPSTLTTALKHGDFHTGTTTREGGSSNEFGLAYECMGFARYFSYYLYGGTMITSGSKHTGYTRFDNYPADGLQPGDYIQLTTTSPTIYHTFIVDSIDGELVNIIEANNQYEVGYCGIYAGPYNPSCSQKPLSLTTLIGYINRGGSTYVLRHNSQLSNTVQEAQAPKLTIQPATNVTANNAKISGSITQYTPLSDVGVLLGTSPNNLKKVKEIKEFPVPSNSSFNIWCDFQEEIDITLNPNTTYYTAFFGESGGKLYQSNTVSFTTNAGYRQVKALNQTMICTKDKAAIHDLPYGSADIIARGTLNGTYHVVKSVINEYGNLWYQLDDQSWIVSSYLKLKPDVKPSTSSQGPTIQLKVPTGITRTNVCVNGRISYKSGQKPSQCGVMIGTDSKHLTKAVAFPINHNANPFDIWCDFQEETNYPLSPGTTYYYTFYATVGGVDLRGLIGSFTTDN